MLVYLVLILFLQYRVNQCTDVTFRETLFKITLSKTSNSSIGVVINGNLNPTDLLQQTGEATVWKVEANNQHVPTLGKNAVEDLPQLSWIILKKCKIKQVRSRAFVNLTKLVNLDLSDNIIDDLSNDAFVNVDLQSLDLSRNNLAFFEHDVFAGLANLSAIYLNYNELEAFEVEWFGDNKKLIWIEVAHNFLRSIQKKAFGGFESLEYLDLDANRIRYIHKESFANSKLVQVLALSNNRLRKLEENLFREMDCLEDLYLHGNNLTFLFATNLNDLKKLKFMALHTNPWQCSCYDKIIEWANANSIKIRNQNECFDQNNPVCIYPTRDESFCLENRTEDLDTIYYNKHNFNKLCNN